METGDLGSETMLCPGCEQAPDVPYTKSLNFSPLVINSTSGGREMVVRYEYQVRCRVPEYAPPYTLLQYSSDRLMQELVVEAPPESAPAEHSFPLYGPSPHIVIVDKSGCANYRVYPVNVASAWSLMDSAYSEVRGRWIVNRTIDVEVPAGQTRGHAVFEQSQYDFSLVWLKLLERNGSQDGILSVVDGTGATIHTETWTALDEGIGHTDYHRRPGDLQLYLNLSAPATSDTSWTMQIRYRSMIPEVCDWGFRFEGLC